MKFFLHLFFIFLNFNFSKALLKNLAIGKNVTTEGNVFLGKLSVKKLIKTENYWIKVDLEKEYNVFYIIVDMSDNKMEYFEVKLGENGDLGKSLSCGKSEEVTYEKNYLNYIECQNKTLNSKFVFIETQLNKSIIFLDLKIYCNLFEEVPDDKIPYPNPIDNFSSFIGSKFEQTNLMRITGVGNLLECCFKCRAINNSFCTFQDNQCFCFSVLSSTNTTKRYNVSYTHIIGEVKSKEIFLDSEVIPQDLHSYKMLEGTSDECIKNCIKLGFRFSITKNDCMCFNLNSSMNWKEMKCEDNNLTNVFIGCSEAKGWSSCQDNFFLKIKNGYQKKLENNLCREKKQNKESTKVNNLLITICGVLVFIVLITSKIILCFFILKTSKKNKRPFFVSNKRVKNPEQVKDTMVPLDQIQDYLLQDKNKIIEKFNNFQTESGASKSVGKNHSNVSKNRFKNIYPYNHNRVKLMKNESRDSDYINASFIPSYGNNDYCYIATQGPKQSTEEDFWLMVFEQNVQLIIMLTNCVEKNILKCSEYWPKKKPKHFGEMKVCLYKIEQNLYFNYKTFIIEKSGFDLQFVHHISYLKWFDNDVPSNLVSFLNLRKEMHDLLNLQKIVKNKLKYIIVHCSAGIGRTGTFILLDYLLKQAEEEGGVKFFEGLSFVRHHRAFSVQNKQQFLFCFNVLDIFNQIGEGTVISTQNKLITNRKLCLLLENKNKNFLIKKQFEVLVNETQKIKKQSYNNLESIEEKIRIIPIPDDSQKVGFFMGHFKKCLKVKRFFTLLTKDISLIIILDKSNKFNETFFYLQENNIIKINNKTIIKLDETVNVDYKKIDLMVKKNKEEEEYDGEKQDEKEREREGEKEKEEEEEKEKEEKERFKKKYKREEIKSHYYNISPVCSNKNILRRNQNNARSFKSTVVQVCSGLSVHTIGSLEKMVSCYSPDKPVLVLSSTSYDESSLLIGCLVAMKMIKFQKWLDIYQAAFEMKILEPSSFDSMKTYEELHVVTEKLSSDLIESSLDSSICFSQT